MLYVEVESAAVSVVAANNVRRHRMCVRVTIVGTRNLLKKETRDILKKDRLCVYVVHKYQFCVE